MAFRLALPLTLAGLVTAGFGCTSDSITPGDMALVEVSVNERADRVDVTVDGQPFTSYLFGEAIPSVKKPILYPVYSPTGQRVTRGFPIHPTPGERADHPHQVGVWLNHGDVNDLDFWNNSDAVNPEHLEHFGSIQHGEIVEAMSGHGSGSLSVVEHWVAPDSSKLLREETSFVFHADAESWFIDRHTTLTAGDDTVTFEDSKEGMMAIRVARPLEHVSDRADPFVTDSGSLSNPIVNNDGATGRYLNSNGMEGDEVWGQRASWTILTGQIAGETVTVAMLDHPRNPNYPTHWMARGYGLFAANPLGSRVYTEGREELDLTLVPGDSVTFRYRLIVHSGERPSSSWIHTQHERFVSDNE